MKNEDLLLTTLRSFKEQKKDIAVYIRHRYLDEINHIVNYDMRFGCRLSLTTLNGFSLLSRDYSWSEIYQGWKSLQSSYMRTVRLKKRVGYFIENYPYVYFLTFTIADPFYNLDHDKYVKSAKDVCRLCGVWSINEDWGDKRGRYHLHAIVGSFDRDILKFAPLWLYGSLDVERLRCGPDDMTRVSRYMTKLTRHCFKDSAGKIWHSRLQKKTKKT